MAAQHRAFSVIALVAVMTVLVLIGSCGKDPCNNGVGPSCPSTSSTSTSTSTSVLASTTTTIGEAGFHYVGTFTQPNGTSLPLDLSAFFNLPRAHISATGRPLEVFDVTGGYNTGSGSFTGSIRGRFDGTLVNGAPNGTFTGTLTANLPGCVAERNYSGPMTREAIAWSPGDHVNTCGGSTPLAAPITPTQSQAPPTTSVSSSSTTSSIGGGGSSTTSTINTSSTTTTVTSSTTTSQPSTTTSPTTSTSTSSTTSSTSSTTSSSTTTTLAPQSVLVFTFTPNPVPWRSQPCLSEFPNRWLFTMGIQNTSTVPFTLQSWTFQGTTTISPSFDYFASQFGTNTIPANGQVSGVLCLNSTVSSAQVRAILTGTNGNGPHQSQILTLAAAIPEVFDISRALFLLPAQSNNDRTSLQR